MGLRLKLEKILVKDNTDRVTSAESSIQQQAALIALKVSNEVYNSLVDRVASAESSISLQADAIALRVKSEDFNGNSIASLINQTATTIKLQANKITLEGLVTANQNFKILTDGSIEAVNAKLSGAITATKMVAVGNTNYYGEIGLSGGSVGLGLFDLNYGTEAFFEILEGTGGNGFIIRDRNNATRFSADTISAQMLSPDRSVRILTSNTGVQIVKNGATIASWGY